MKRNHLLREAIALGLSLIIALLFCTVGGVSADELVYGYTTAEEQDFVIALMDVPNDVGTAMFSYFPGVRVELLSDLKGDWLHVRVCNIAGYMKDEHVSFDAEYAKAKYRLPIWTMTGKHSDSGTVNFRELPTFDIPPISYYYIQDKKEVHVMGISEEWFHINVDGRMGFLKPDYLKDEEKMDEYVIGPFQSPLRENWR